MRYAIIDGHADTPVELYIRGVSALADAAGHVTLEGMKKLGRYAQFFAYCVACFPEQQPEQLYENSMAAFERELLRHGEQMTLCGNTAQMKAAWEQGKTAAFFAIEGAESIGCDPGRLEEAAARGVRMVSLMWNYENALGGSNQSGGGLTARGREFVRRAQSLNMVLDVSHASDEVFYEVCELAEKPFAASHSNCRALCEHPRNLTDDQLRCIIQMGGTAGVNLFPPFLRGKTAGFDDVRRHLDHVLDLGGEDSIALGGDLDGCGSLPVGFTGVESYEDMMEYLEKQGYSKTLLEKLCSGNLMRVMEACDLRPV